MSSSSNNAETLTIQNIERIKNMVSRQTNYADDIILKKLEEHNYDPLIVIREYMGLPIISNANNKIKESNNQQIYCEIRSFMDTATKAYNEKKELEEKQAILKNNISSCNDKIIHS
jgi:hypothetical protein